MPRNSELALTVDSLVNALVDMPISSNAYVATKLLGKNLAADRNESTDYAGTIYSSVDMPA